jgi:hypothetical protein
MACPLSTHSSGGKRECPRARAQGMPGACLGHSRGIRGSLAGHRAAESISAPGRNAGEVRARGPRGRGAGGPKGRRAEGSSRLAPQTIAAWTARWIQTRSVSETSRGSDSARHKGHSAAHRRAPAVRLPLTCQHPSRQPALPTPARPRPPDPQIPGPPGSRGLSLLPSSTHPLIHSSTHPLARPQRHPIPYLRALALPSPQTPVASAFSCLHLSLSLSIPPIPLSTPLHAARGNTSRQFSRGDQTSPSDRFHRCPFPYSPRRG